MLNTRQTYCVLVRGTSFSPFRAALPRWVRPASSIRQKILERIPDCVIEPFHWSGAFNQSARHEAAAKLAQHLNEIRTRYDRIILVGHSHGGNVAIEAAYHSPLAPVEIVALSTPFLTASSTKKGELEKRLSLLFFTICLVAAVGLAVMFGGNERIVTAIGLVLMAILISALVRRTVVPRFAKTIAHRESEVLGRFTNAPVRGGIRCLVLSHPSDEIMSAFRDIKSWASRYFWYGGLRETAQLRGNVLPPDLVRLLIRFGVLLLFGVTTLALAPLLPAPWLLIPAVMGALALLVAFYFCLVLVAIMFSVSLFLVAAFIVIILWPIVSLGANFDSLFVTGTIKSRPKAEAGAIIEYFEFTDEGNNALQSSLDRMAPIRSPLYKGTVRARIRDAFRVGLGTVSGILNVTRLLIRTAFALRHRRVYDDPAVLTKIQAWL